jgi:hypothetical protein
MTGRHGQAQYVVRGPWRLWLPRPTALHGALAIGGGQCARTFVSDPRLMSMVAGRTFWGAWGLFITFQPTDRARPFMSGFFNSID